MSALDNTVDSLSQLSSFLIFPHRTAVKVYGGDFFGATERDPTGLRFELLVCALYNNTWRGLAVAYFAFANKIKSPVVRLTNKEEITSFLDKKFVILPKEHAQCYPRKENIILKCHL